jgi:hypothetical protein
MDLKIYTARVPMGMHNVFSPCIPGEEYEERIIKSVVHPDMVPFITALQTKRPSWVFLGTDYGVYFPATDTYRRTGFTVVQGNEELGRIARSTDKYGDPVFCVNNPRIDAQRTRTGAYKTKHLNKAVNETLKYFFGKTLEERMRETKQKVDKAVYQAVTGKQYDYEREVRKVQLPLLYHLAKHPKLLDDLALPDEKANTALHKAVQHCMLYKEAFDISAKKENGRAVIVAGMAEHMYVAPATTPSEATKHSYESLPPYVAMGMGMLKLVDVGASIAEIGMRIGDDTFLIIKPHGEP